MAARPVQARPLPFPGGARLPVTLGSSWAQFRPTPRPATAPATVPATVPATAPATAPAAVPAVSVFPPPLPVVPASLTTAPTLPPPVAPTPTPVLTPTAVAPRPPPVLPAATPAPEPPAAVPPPAPTNAPPEPAPKKQRAKPGEGKPRAPRTKKVLTDADGNVISKPPRKRAPKSAAAGAAKKAKAADGSARVPGKDSSSDSSSDEEDGGAPSSKEPKAVLKELGKAVVTTTEAEKKIQEDRAAGAIAFANRKSLFDDDDEDDLVPPLASVRPVAVPPPPPVSVQSAATAPVLEEVVAAGIAPSDLHASVAVAPTLVAPKSVPKKRASRAGKKVEAGGAKDAKVVQPDHRPRVVTGMNAVVQAAQLSALTVANAFVQNGHDPREYGVNTPETIAAMRMPADAARWATTSYAMRMQQLIKCVEDHFAQRRERGGPVTVTEEETRAVAMKYACRWEIFTRSPQLSWLLQGNAELTTETTYQRSGVGGRVLWTSPAVIFALSVCCHNAPADNPLLVRMVQEVSSSHFFQLNCADLVLEIKPDMRNALIGTAVRFLDKYYMKPNTEVYSDDEMERYAMIAFNEGNSTDMRIAAAISAASSACVLWMNAPKLPQRTCYHPIEGEFGQGVGSSDAELRAWYQQPYGTPGREHQIFECGSVVLKIPLKHWKDDAFKMHLPLVVYGALQLVPLGLFDGFCVREKYAKKATDNDKKFPSVVLDAVKALGVQKSREACPVVSIVSRQPTTLTPTVLGRWIRYIQDETVREFIGSILLSERAGELLRPGSSTLHWACALHDLGLPLFVIDPSANQEMPEGDPDVYFNDITPTPGEYYRLTAASRLFASQLLLSLTLTLDPPPKVRAPPKKAAKATAAAAES